MGTYCVSNGGFKCVKTTFKKQTQNIIIMIEIFDYLSEKDGLVEINCLRFDYQEELL